MPRALFAGLDAALSALTLALGSATVLLLARRVLGVGADSPSAEVEL